MLPRTGNSLYRLHSFSGFSLIEVIAAMAICMLGMAVVLEMSNLSRRFARNATAAVEQQILCQNRIDELLAGLTPLENVTDQPCPENQLFVYSVDVDSHEQIPLALVIVTVQLADDGMGVKNTSSNEASEKPSRKREAKVRQFTLRRWMAIPSLPGAKSTTDSTPLNQQTLPLPNIPSAEEDRP